MLSQIYEEKTTKPVRDDSNPNRSSYIDKDRVYHPKPDSITKGKIPPH